MSGSFGGPGTTQQAVLGLTDHEVYSLYCSSFFFFPFCPLSFFILFFLPLRANVLLVTHRLPEYADACLMVQLLCALTFVTRVWL